MNYLSNINNRIVNKIGIRADLLLHFEVSALICLLLCIFLPSWVAGLITLAIGIIKEIYDKYKPNATGFDLWDLLADLLGILVIC